MNISSYFGADYYYFAIVLITSLPPTGEAISQSPPRLLREAILRDIDATTQVPLYHRHTAATRHHYRDNMMPAVAVPRSIDRIYFGGARGRETRLTRLFSRR